MAGRGHLGRILFVDDDKSGRELSRYNLEAADYAVDLAGNGGEALEQFAAHRYDLVITDLRMPKVSGMELLARIKQRAPEVPVLVITAHGSVETATEAMRAGAIDLVEKPFTRDMLLRAVSRAMEHRLAPSICSPVLDCPSSMLTLFRRHGRSKDNVRQASTTLPWTTPEAAKPRGRTAG